MDSFSCTSKKRKLNSDERNQFTRSTVDKFDWKSNCFICGNRCFEKKRYTWSKVESAVDKSSKLYSRVLRATEIKNDRDMISRLLSCNGDLVSVEARYHRQKPCLPTYMLNVPEPSDVPQSVNKGPVAVLCGILKSELHECMAVGRQVFELSFLKTRVLELSQERNIKVEDELSTRYFKTVLQNEWPDLKFIPRKGLTPLVCIKDLMEVEAIQRAAKYESMVREAQELENSFVDESTYVGSSEDEMSILHKAALILREKVVSRKNILDQEYFSVDEITPNQQKEYLDPMLLQFVNWVSSKSCGEEGDVGDVTRKVVGVASDISYLISPNSVTPKHLALSVYLHHTFGSKKLIEDLSELGHTITYSEVRHFLTSAALFSLSTQTRTPSGAMVPTNLKSGEEDDTLMVFVADNWDHNEHSLTGKKSTHAMTSILVAPQSLTIQSSNRIPRAQYRSIVADSLPGKGFSKILTYTKPTERPEPCLQPPVTLDELNYPEPKSYQTLKLKELLYNIGRLNMFCDDRTVSVTVEPWTVFQSVVEPDCLSGPSTVLFNPIIMATPTNVSTIYTTLKRAKEQMNALGQTICPVFFDMGLLSKALEIVWAKKEEFQGVIPMEGGMHFLMSCFSGIGYLYGELGLKHLLHVSDVYGKNTAEQIFQGNDFDRALRAIILIDEVLTQKFLKNFYVWLTKKGKTLPKTVIDEVSNLLGNLSTCDQDTIGTVIEHVGEAFLPLLEEFRADGRNISPLFQLWDDYLTRVSQPVKLFLASTRHAKWNAHHYAKVYLLPFLFAANRTTYARYMTYMVFSMNRLPKKALESFSKGNFVAKLTDGRFNSVWMDYLLEVTENKTLKSSGGIIGLTHIDNALVRWFLSRPVTASYSLAYKGSQVGSKMEQKHHTDTNFFKSNYNQDLSKMSEMFSETFIDPFNLSDPPSRLINFATGVEVSIATEESLLNCYTEGEKVLEKFVQERLLVQEGNCKPSKSFFEPISKSKVKTIKGVKSAVNVKQREVTIGGEETYLRLLAINSFKKVPLERVMTFENAPVPISLFDDNGHMMSNKKSDFMEKLESVLQPDSVLKELPNDGVDAIVFDAMAVMHMLQPVSSPVKPTFSDLTEVFWSYILNKGKNIKTIHVVFDRYLKTSLKMQTRQKRGDVSYFPSHVQPNMTVQDYKHILASSSGKQELSRFYTTYVCENAHILVPPASCIVVSGGLKNKAVQIKPNCISYVPALYSNQEEADTRMLLHVKYSCNISGAMKVVVFSLDTDVLVLLVHHYFNLGVRELFFKTGRAGVYANYTRFIPVHGIIESLTSEQQSILLSVYCLSGCDTCSSFFGIGKKKVFNVLIRSAKDLQNLAFVGSELILPGHIRTECVRFVGFLYGTNQCTSLNKLRTEKVQGNKSINPKKLPPTDDSFLLHLLRCTYQLLIWKGCLEPLFQLPNPIDYGYYLDSESGLYKPQLMSQSCAPPELLSDLVCKCVDFCEKECACLANEQPCTVACECKSVVNGEDVCMNVFTALALIDD